MVLAGFLHDMGKFLQRGSFTWLKDRVRHPERSGEFIGAFGDLFRDIADLPLLRTLVEHHHESPSFGDFTVQKVPQGRARTLACLVSEADNLSSAERDEAAEGYQDYRTTPLAPVFGRVTLNGSEAPKTLRYHARWLSDPASLGTIFPDGFTQFSPGEMNNLLMAFSEEFNGLSKGVNKTDFNLLITHLMGISQKYLWCLPSNTQESQPDVSLYDHLKTTAAIAACLYRYHVSMGTLDEKAIKKDAPKFLMVVGDLSGIQNYIFDIATTGAGGVARRLRARSLFIQLITEVAAHRILRDMDLPLTNLVMQSGGKFYLLLPNIAEAKETIEKAQREMDKWLLDELNGEIALNLAMTEFGHSGFKPESGGFGAILKKLDDRLQRRKRQPFKEALAGLGGWDENAFLRPANFAGEQPCDSCHKFPRLCRRCDKDREWGKVIPNAKYIAFFEEETSGDLPILGCSVSLWKKPEKVDPLPYLVLKLNDPDMSDLYRYPALPRYLANHIPRARDFDCGKCRRESDCDDAHKNAEDEPATFQCLAAYSNGRHLLGFLKADVDNLGKTFAFGLRRDTEQSFDSISRLTTFSRMLDLFFSGWVEHLTQNEFKHCYTVFSGGDDLFLVGPWDEILKLAQRVREDFERYTGNPEITLSSGVFINKDRFPISRAAREADDAVETAKRSGRDAITVLSRSLPWTEWAFVRGEWRKLADSGEEVSSGFLYSLVQYAEMWGDYKRGNVLGLRFQPLLAYNISRNLDKAKTPYTHAWAETFIKPQPFSPTQQLAIDNLGLLARLLIYGKEKDK